MPICPAEVARVDDLGIPKLVLTIKEVKAGEAVHKGSEPSLVSTVEEAPTVSPARVSRAEA